MRAKLARPEMEPDILGKQRRTLQWLDLKYAFVQRHRWVWPISVQCRMLQVSVAGHHEHSFADLPALRSSAAT